MYSPALQPCGGFQLAHESPSALWHSSVFISRGVSVSACAGCAAPARWGGSAAEFTHLTHKHLVDCGSVFNCAKQVPGLNYTSAAMAAAMGALSVQGARSKCQPPFPFTMVTWRKYSLMLNTNLEEAVQEKAHTVTGNQSALL